MENTVIAASPLDIPVRGWLPIETAPKDGTELLAWREDAGVFIVRWTAPLYFMSDSEINVVSEGGDDTGWLEQEDWFFADFVSGDRLEGDLVPTHWMPLPEAPNK